MVGTRSIVLTKPASYTEPGRITRGQEKMSGVRVPASYSVDFARGSAGIPARSASLSSRLPGCAATSARKIGVQVRLEFEEQDLELRLPQVSRDGERFLMTKVPGERPTRIAVVLNWFDELRAKVPH